MLTRGSADSLSRIKVSAGCNGGMSFNGCCHGGLRRDVVPNTMVMVVCDAASFFFSDLMRGVTAMVQTECSLPWTRFLGRVAGKMESVARWCRRCCSAKMVAAMLRRGGFLAEKIHGVGHCCSG